jgi:hypothetical protein
MFYVKRGLIVEGVGTGLRHVPEKALRRSPLTEHAEKRRGDDEDGRYSGLQVFGSHVNIQEGVSVTS